MVEKSGAGHQHTAIQGWNGGASVSSISAHVCFKSGALQNRVTEHALCGLKPSDIDWVWIVEQKRNATPEEIKWLCKRPK
jgi:hypothetical protein